MVSSRDSAPVFAQVEEFRARARKRQSVTRLAVAGFWLAAGSFLALLIYGAAWLLSAGASLAAGELSARTSVNSIQPAR